MKKITQDAALCNGQDDLSTQNVADPHAITVLTVTEAPYPTKTIGLVDGVPTKKKQWTPKWFKSRIEILDSPDAIEFFLRNIAPKKRQVPIRGVMIDPSQARVMHRRLLVAQADGTQATYRDAPRYYVAGDVDKLPLPPHIDMVREPDQAVEFAVNYLCEKWPELSDVELVVRLSSSCGHFATNTISFHFWFLNKHPLTCQQLKKIFSKVKDNFAALDASVASPEKFLFCADAILEDGIEDPLPERIFRFPAKNERADIRPLSPDEVTEATRRRKAAGTGAGLDLEVFSGLSPDNCLARMGDQSEGGPGYRVPIMAAIRNGVQSGELTSDEASVAAFHEQKIAPALKASATPSRLKDGSITEYMSFAHSRNIWRHYVNTFQIRRTETVARFTRKGNSKHGTLGGARRVLDDALKDFFSAPADLTEPATHLVEATTGVGKTRAALDHAARKVKSSQSIRVDFFAPTLEKADELAQDATEFLPAEKIAVLRGRKAADPNGHLKGVADCEEGADGLMCGRPSAIDYALRIGAFPRRFICRTCPLQNECGYERQFRAAEDEEAPTPYDVKKSGGLLIAAHAQLTVPRRLGIGEYVVIDEDPTSALIQEKTISRMALTPGSPAVVAIANAAIDALMSPRQAATLAKALENDDLLDLFQNRAPSPRLFLKAMNAAVEATAWSLTHEACAGMTDNDREAMRDELTIGAWIASKAQGRLLGGAGADDSGDCVSGVDSILWAVFEALDAIDRGGIGRRATPLKDGWRVARRLRLRVDEVPILVLDATPRHEVLEAALGRRLTSVAKATAKEHLDITRIAMSGSKSSLFGRNARVRRSELSDGDKAAETAHLGSLMKPISSTLGDGRDVLLVTQKETLGLVEEHNIVPESWRRMHFGALRGLNSAEDCSAVVVLGRQLPAVEDLERIASA